MSDIITHDLLRSWSPCKEGYKRFCELFPNGANLTEAINGLAADGHDDWGWWLFLACKSAGICTDVTNSGYRNSGDRNSGHRNSGYWNSGDWNSGNRNSGYFNADTPSTVRVFGKLCPVGVWEDAYKPRFLYFDVTAWIEPSDMTDQEKADHPFYAITGGILRTYAYKEAFRRSWERADPADRIKVKDLPHFDAEIFYQISGIDLREEKAMVE